MCMQTACVQYNNRVYVRGHKYVLGPTETHFSPSRYKCFEINFVLVFLFRSISLEEIISKLIKGYIAIVLVNSNALVCNWCEVYTPNKLRIFADCLCPSPPREYCGHYIVLCGFDADKRSVYYKNPSFNENLCCTKFDMFESARHSYGTDDDIIFIKLEDHSQSK